LLRFEPDTRQIRLDRFIAFNPEPWLRFEMKRAGFSRRQAGVAGPVLRPPEHQAMPGFLRHERHALREYGHDRDCLELEIGFGRSVFDARLGFVRAVFVLNVAVKSPEPSLSGGRFATTRTTRAPVGSITSESHASDILALAQAPPWSMPGYNRRNRRTRRKSCISGRAETPFVRVIRTPHL
jgi:hypothetical protein